MENKITIKRLKPKSIFKLVFIGNAVVLIPFAVLCGFMGLFGMGTITWNDKPMTGIPGLIASPFIGAFMVVISSILGWIVLCLGLWFYSKYKNIDLEYIPVE